MAFTFEQRHRNRKSWTYAVELDGEYVAMLHDNDDGSVSVRDLRRDLPKTWANEIREQFHEQRQERA